MSDPSTRLFFDLDSQNPSSIRKLFNVEYINENRDEYSTFLSKTSRIKKNSFRQILQTVLSIVKCDSLNEQLNVYRSAISMILKNSTEFDKEYYSQLIREVLQSLRYFSIVSDYQICCNELRNILQSIRTISDNSPFLAVVNELMILFIRNRLFKEAQNISSNSSAKIERCENMNAFTNSDWAQYNFLSGRVCLVFSRFAEAATYFAESLKKIPLYHSKDRRNVLVLFIPVQLTLGIIPSKELREKYHIFYYDQLISSIENGDTDMFSNYVNENYFDLVQLGVWNAVMKAKCFVYLTLIKIVFRIHEEAGNIKPFINLSLFREAFGVDSNNDAISILSLLNTEEIISIKISEGIVVFIKHPITQQTTKSRGN